MSPRHAVASAPEVLSVDALRGAFERFSEAAAALESQQRALRQRIADLDVELAETNDQLSASLEAQATLATNLNGVLENLSAGVIAVDACGRVSTVNRAALGLLGCGSEALMGKRVVEAVGDRLNTSLIAEAAEADWSQPRTTEIAVGGEAKRRHLRVQASPARDVETGEPRGGIVVIEDITAVVHWRERAALNERLSTMGQVAAQVAHEIRNPLGSIELFASALRTELAGSPGRATELAGHIVTGVRSLDALVSNILLFARGREPETAPVTWETIAEAALKQTSPALDQAGAQIVCRWGADGAHVLGDADLLTQALVNLIINAAQALAAVDGGRVITVETAHEGDKVTLRVSDTGPGVEPAGREQIFDPFITTRRRGTGLGLTIVAHIVAAHRGAVRCVESESGGASFEITLAAAGAAEDGGEH